MFEKSTKKREREREEGMEFISLKRNERKHNARIDGWGWKAKSLKITRRGRERAGVPKFCLSF